MAKGSCSRTLEVLGKGCRSVDATLIGRFQEFRLGDFSKIEGSPFDRFFGEEVEVDFECKAQNELQSIADSGGRG